MKTRKPSTPKDCSEENGYIQVASGSGYRYVVPFPWRLHEMLTETSKDSDLSNVVYWMPDGKSFRIVDIARFTAEVIPNYFKQKNFKSFQRQLQLYGFRRIPKGPNEGAHFHPFFVREDRQLTRNIVRSGARTIPTPVKPKASTRKGRSSSRNKAVKGEPNATSKGSQIIGKSCSSDMVMDPMSEWSLLAHEPVVCSSRFSPPATVVSDSSTSGHPQNMKDTAVMPCVVGSSAPPLGEMVCPDQSFDDMTAYASDLVSLLGDIDGDSLHEGDFLDGIADLQIPLEDVAADPVLSSEATVVSNEEQRSERESPASRDDWFHGDVLNHPIDFGLDVSSYNDPVVSRPIIGA